jgi:hypothetical protein
VSRRHFELEENSIDAKTKQSAGDDQSAGEMRKDQRWKNKWGKRGGKNKMEWSVGRKRWPDQPNGQPNFPARESALFDCGPAALNGQPRLTGQWPPSRLLGWSAMASSLLLRCCSCFAQKRERKSLIFSLPASHLADFLLISWLVGWLTGWAGCTVGEPAASTATGPAGFWPSFRARLRGQAFDVQPAFAAAAAAAAALLLVVAVQTEKKREESSPIPASPFPISRSINWWSRQASMHSTTKKTSLADWLLAAADGNGMAMNTAMQAQTFCCLSFGCQIIMWPKPTAAAAGEVRRNAIGGIYGTQLDVLFPTYLFFAKLYGRCCCTTYNNVCKSFAQFSAGLITAHFPLFHRIVCTHTFPLAFFAFYLFPQFSNFFLNFFLLALVSFLIENYKNGKNSKNIDKIQKRFLQLIFKLFNQIRY